jgi:hypothetical protein
MVSSGILLILDFVKDAHTYAHTGWWSYKILPFPEDNKNGLMDCIAWHWSSLCWRHIFYWPMIVRFCLLENNKLVSLLQHNIQRLQKKKTNQLKNKTDQLVDRKEIPSIYRKQITHLQSGNQTYMELRSRTVGLRPQVLHSHLAEIPIQISYSHSKCTLVCNKS